MTEQDVGRVRKGIGGRTGVGALALLSLSTLSAVACSSSSHGSAVPDASAPEASATVPDEVSGCGSSLASITSCVDQARLREDVGFVAAPRLPGSAHWQAVQDLCAQRFAQYGFQVELHKYATGVNVIGTRRGADQPDQHVLVSAHYDHIANCPGADDNATGVAAVLETARVLESAKLSRTLILACWDEEESGLIGARAYAARAKANGDEIVVMTSLEMIGFKSDAPNSQKVPAGFDALFRDQYAALVKNELRADFVSLIALDSATALARAFETRALAADLPTSLILLTPEMASSPLLSDLSRSDHAAFWLEGFPALLVTDTSNFRYAQYHCRAGDDVPALLSYSFLASVTRASVAAHLDIVGLE